VLARSLRQVLLAATFAIAPRVTLGASPAKTTNDLGEACPNLYSDTEARDLARRAKDSVPIGTARRKDVVLKALGIAPTRLCNHQVEAFNLGYVESWQISQGFDIRWAAAAQDRTPLDRKDRKIFHVRVVPRETPLSDTWS
jgi:hypothetical protein